TTLPLRNLMNRAPLRAFLLIPFVLASFALSPTARAVDPPPDGGYPNANTAEGEDALFSLTSGSDNTAVGFNALFSNTTGFGNTANGVNALFNNTTGNFNTANGYQALINNTIGSFNTAIGFNALGRCKRGDNNIAIGRDAGRAFNSIENHNIDIGNVGVTGESDTIRIGTSGSQTNAYIAGISGVTVAGGIGVIVDSSGHLGTTTSSARF